MQPAVDTGTQQPVCEAHRGAVASVSVRRRLPLRTNGRAVANPGRKRSKSERALKGAAGAGVCLGGSREREKGRTSRRRVAATGANRGRAREGTRGSEAGTACFRSIETQPHGLASVFLNWAPSRAGQPAFFLLEFLYFGAAKSDKKFAAARSARARSVSGRGLRSARPVVAAAQPRAGVGIPTWRHQWKSRPRWWQGRRRRSE